MRPGRTVTTGAVVSRTVTGNPHELALPEPSTAVQTAVVVPTGKVEPDGGAQVAVVAPQLSTADGAKVATAPPPTHSRTCGAGQVTAGAVRSTTVTAAPQTSLAPKVSV